MFAVSDIGIESLVVVTGKKCNNNYYYIIIIYIYKIKIIENIAVYLTSDNTYAITAPLRGGVSIKNSCTDNDTAERMMITPYGNNVELNVRRRSRSCRTS